MLLSIFANFFLISDDNAEKRTRIISEAEKRTRGTNFYQKFSVMLSMPLKVFKLHWGLI